MGDKYENRIMLPLSLSYDHRVIDGAELAIKRSVYRPVHIEGEIQPSKDLITRHEFQYYAEEQVISEPEILDQPLENPMT